MSHPDQSRFMVECECAGTCGYLVFDKWNDETDFWADIYTVPRNFTLRWRLKMAWRSLWGRPTYEPGILIRGGEATRLASWLAVELGYKQEPVTTSSGANVTVKWGQT